MIGTCGYCRLCAGHGEALVDAVVFCLLDWIARFGASIRGLHCNDCGSYDIREGEYGE